MKKLLIIVTIFIVCDFSQVYALSGIDAGAVNSSLVKDLRLHETVKRDNKKVEIKKEEQQELKNEIEQASMDSFTNIKYITFVNNVSIPTQELLNTIKNYINKPMNVQNISNIRKEIMKYYQNKGYYSALVIVNSENSQTGELVLDIKEGGKNSIIIEE